MKYFKRILIILHLFVGVGAMAGGFSAISNPQSPMGISTEILKNSPFPDFLIPGLLLFGVIGVGNIICAGFAIKGPWYYPYISGVFGGALMVWIIVQCIMIQSIVFLHILFFSIGAVQAAMAAYLLFRDRMFPFDLIDTLWNKFFVKVK